jgi:microcystin-dependent protein
MSEPYVGQIEIFGFGFAPKGWALCAGQLLQINQNQSLFSVIGTAFGGDGMRTFGLPDLRGRTPIGQGNGPGLTPRPIGTVTGEPNHLLTITETPLHNHAIQAATTDSTKNPNTNTPDGTTVLATSYGLAGDGTALEMKAYVSGPAEETRVKMAPSATTSTGGGSVHDNMMPYLTLNVCISLAGPIPPRS